MGQDMPPKIPISDADLERYIDRPFDLVARVRAAKEAAQREMETFGNVSEYEIRKIYGQKSELSYDALDGERSQTHPSHSEDQRKSHHPEVTNEAKAVETQASFDFVAPESVRPQEPVKEDS